MPERLPPGVRRVGLGDLAAHQVLRGPAGGSFCAVVRVGTPGEAGYRRYGGIMLYVSRSLLISG